MYQDSYVFVKICVTLINASAHYIYIYIYIHVYIYISSPIVHREYAQHVGRSLRER